MFTGGHLTPAVAVLQELKDNGYSNFVWVGTKYNQSKTKTPSAEYSTIKGFGIKFYNLRTGKLIRDWGFSTFLYGIKNLILIKFGFIKSIYVVIKERPDLVVSFGGYVALPIVIVAKFLRIKVVTHEQTLVTGLANKIIARFANIVFISWENSRKLIKNKNIIFSGNPIRQDIFKINDSNLLDNLDSNKPTILVMGGNQGAYQINQRVFSIIKDLIKDFNVIHQTGNSSATKDNEHAAHILASLDKNIKGRYLPLDYINSTNIGAVFNKADILISRSGANTIAEILALGKLSILIPIPSTSNNEQIKNAQFVEETGLAINLSQKNLAPEKLYQSVLLVRNQLNLNKSLKNEDLSITRSKAKELIKLNASKIIVKEIENLLLK